MAASATQHAVQRTERFMERLRERAPLFWKEVDRNLAANPELFRELADPMLLWASGLLGEGFEDVLIDGYSSFVVDVNRSQLRYEQTGRYENNSYEEVFDKTYDSAEFMSLYHWGVYVATFAWEHHLRIYRFYRDHFLSRLRGSDGGELLDLGCGSGVWHMIALAELDDWKATAVDISETSIHLSRAMAETAGLSRAVTYHCEDAIRFRSNRPADAGISCLLLEHLERPQQLLANLARQIEQRKYAFVTCALTAAETDHIYEFVRESEIVLMAEEAGFRVVSLFSSSPDKASNKNRFLPRSLAMVLQKRAGEIW